jgi:hypothetical protein
MDEKRILNLWSNFRDGLGAWEDQPWFPEWVKPKRLRGKWPVVLQHLKVKYPLADHPNGFPDPAFVPRNVLLSELRDLHPRLKQLDNATLDKAIAAYNREIRNSSE